MRWPLGRCAVAFCAVNAILIDMPASDSALFFNGGVLRRSDLSVMQWTGKDRSGFVGAKGVGQAFES